MRLSWALQVTQMPPKEDPISDPFVRSEERGDTQMSSPRGRRSCDARSVLISGKDGGSRVEGGRRAYGHETPALLTNTLTSRPWISMAIATSFSRLRLTRTSPSSAMAMTQPIPSVAPMRGDLGAVATTQVLAGAEEGDVDTECEADGGTGRDEEAPAASAQASWALRNSTWAHEPAMVEFTSYYEWGTGGVGALRYVKRSRLRRSCTECIWVCASFVGREKQ
jgi:hypothetical protein